MDLKGPEEIPLRVPNNCNRWSQLLIGKEDSDCSKAATFDSREWIGRVQISWFGRVLVSSDSMKHKMVKTFQAYLPEKCHRLYSCVHCRAHLANHDELISKSFQGSQGRAYLFNSVVNIGCGPAEERVLLTGLHAVADIFCECCKTTLGWKYEHAFESSQKYKEGKYIIELAHMIKDNGWE